MDLALEFIMNETEHGTNTTDIKREQTLCKLVMALMCENTICAADPTRDD